MAWSRAKLPTRWIKSSRRIRRPRPQLPSSSPVSPCRPPHHPHSPPTHRVAPCTLDRSPVRVVTTSLPALPNIPFRTSRHARSRRSFPIPAPPHRALLALRALIVDVASFPFTKKSLRWCQLHPPPTHLLLHHIPATHHTTLRLSPHIPPPIHNKHPPDSTSPPSAN